MKIQGITHSSQEEEMCLVSWDCTKKNYRRNQRSVISLGADLELSDLEDIVRFKREGCSLDILALDLLYQYKATAVQDCKSLPKESMSR